MEERLYFKPANYGKGKEKSAPSKEKSCKKAKKLGISLFVVILALIIFFFLRGKTITTGRYPENIRNEYLDCTAEIFTYSKVGEIASDKKELKTTMVFLGDEELSSISLKYTLNFENSETAKRAEPVVNTRFHENLAKIIDDYSAFNNKVTVIDDAVIVTLRASKTDLADDLTKEFFAIKKTDTPSALDDFRDIYESQGFSCRSSIDNN